MLVSPVAGGGELNPASHPPDRRHNPAFCRR